MRLDGRSKITAAQNPWKKKTLTNYIVRPLQEKIFENGKLVYKSPILKEISSRLEKIIGLPVDFTVLSVKEEHDLKFLKKIELQYLKIK